MLGGDGRPMALSSQITLDKTVYKRNEPVLLTWRLTNHSTKGVLVLSHYATTEGKHFDNLTLDIVRSGNHQTWRLPLLGARKAVAKVACLLKPSETLRHEINLTAWLNQHHVNLGLGRFEIALIYQVASNESAMRDWVNCKDIKSDDAATPPLIHGASNTPWRGTLKSNSVAFQIVE